MIHMAFLGVITLGFFAFVVGVFTSIKEGNYYINWFITLCLLFFGMVFYWISLYLAVKGIMMGQEM